MPSVKMKFIALALAVYFSSMATLAGDVPRIEIEYSCDVQDRMDEIERMISSEESFAKADIERFITDTFSQFYLSSSFNWRFREKGFEQLKKLALKYDINFVYDWKKLAATLFRGLDDPSNLALGSLALVTIAGTALALITFSNQTAQEKHSPQLPDVHSRAALYSQRYQGTFNNGTSGDFLYLYNNDDGILIVKTEAGCVLDLRYHSRQYNNNMTELAMSVANSSLNTCVDGLSHMIEPLKLVMAYCCPGNAYNFSLQNLFSSLCHKIPNFLINAPAAFGFVKCKDPIH